MPPACRKAFILVELLVGVGIIGVVICLLLPVARRLREASRRAEDLSSLRQLTAACTSFATEHEGLLPPGRISNAPPNQDNYTWINYKDCWRLLVSRSPGL